MKRFYKSWTLAEILMIALASAIAPRAAAQGGGVIRGQIMDVAGKPWVDMAIQVASDQGVKYDTKTDKEGNYVVRNLKSGVYTVNVLLPAPNPPYQVKCQVSSGAEAKVDVNFKNVIAKQGASAQKQMKTKEQKQVSIAQPQTEKQKQESIAQPQTEKQKQESIAQPQTEKQKQESIAQPQTEKQKQVSIAQSQTEKQKQASIAQPQTEKQKQVSTAQAKQGAAKTALQAATPPETKLQHGAIRAKQDEARAAETLGNWNRASDLQWEAVQLAKQTGDKVDLADASLKHAQASEWSARKDPAHAAKLEEAATSSYRVAIENGSVAQKRVAQNNLATLLLRQKKPEDALKLLRTMSYGDIPVSERYVYLYNTARASEQAGDSTSALKRYSEALESQAGFEPAIKGMFRVAWKLPKGRSTVVGVGQRLLDAGQATTVLPYLHDSLKVWADDPQVQEILALLVRCYADLAMEPGAFEKAEWPLLSGLTSGPLSTAVREIRVAFSGPLPLHFYEPFESGPVHAWRGTSWKEQPYAALLAQLGDYYRGRARFGDALARYALAWSVNGGEVSAALYAADILMEHGSDVDPEGRLLNDFIEKLFMSKGQAYKSDDWLNILRLHTILGTIYSRQKKWGASGDPRGARFQFEHALQAEQRYRAQHPEFPRSPGLYSELGEVYLALNLVQEAGRQFLAAADVYKKEGHSSEARAALGRVRPILQNLDQADRQRFADLAQLIHEE